MFVTHSIEFTRDTLNTSIEDFVSLNYNTNFSRNDDVFYYIIMKHLIKYLKNHPASKICNHLMTSSILIKLKDMCFIHMRNIGTEEINVFTAAKKLELKLQDNGNNVFVVWYYIDTVLEQFELKCERGEYGY